MAYYRAGWESKKLICNTDFWLGINGNCIDIAVLEWCKLFADHKDRHHWKKVISSPEEFEEGLLEALGPGMTLDGFNYFSKTVKTYRDKFVAHLDNELVANIPSLNDCWISVEFYHKYLFRTETNSYFYGLPNNIASYYNLKFDEAKLVYQANKK